MPDTERRTITGRTGKKPQCRSCDHDQERHDVEAGGCIECRCERTKFRQSPRPHERRVPTHYKRTPRTGPLERISRWVDTTAGPDSCWEWQGARSPGGYGRTHLVINGVRRSLNAHRAVYMLLADPGLTQDQLLLHSCDNPPCCNPAHLRPGTQLENMYDRKTRGAGYPKGADHYAALQIAPEVVAAIRADYRWRVTGRGTPALAEKYGISRSVVQKIVTHSGRWAADR